MRCPICKSNDCEYTGDLPTIYEVCEDGFIILLDFKCYCPECRTIFYRREEFIYNDDTGDEWVAEESE